MVTGCVCAAVIGGCPQPESSSDSSASGSSAVVTTRNLTNVVDTQVGGDPIVAVRGITDVDVYVDIPPGPRQFTMGAVAIGFESTDYVFEDIAHSIERNNQISDTIVTRPLVDWEHFRPNGTGPAVTTNEVEQIINHATASGIPHSVIEMDPLLNRHSVSPLPPALEGKNFSDEEIQIAHSAMALELARKLQPTYISFAVEVNAYYESNPEDFLNFVAHHKRLYHQIKEVSPNTQIAVSMNYEALTGLLGQVDDRLSKEPRWEIIDFFLPELDVLALSTLPWPVFGKPRELPSDYLSSISENTSLPIIITECGWTTAAEANSNEHDQAEYVARIARMAENAPQLRLLAWSISSDPPDGSIFDSFPAFQRLGLTRNSGEDRPAYYLWKELFERPYVPNFEP